MSQAPDLLMAVRESTGWVDRCPITYARLRRSERLYSREGLRSFSPNLRSLNPLAWTADGLRAEAARRVGKMSIGGVQPKVSAVLDEAAGDVELVSQGGRYILKPAVVEYPELPANEDLTMRLASAAGGVVPLHGLLYATGGSLCYAIRRFDRVGSEKRAVEDFGQLLGRGREAKYSGAMEDAARVVEEFCTTPVLDKAELLRITLVSFLVGNEDLHLKNLSVLSHPDGRRTLSPLYDVVNSTVAMGGASDELALSLGGKKSGFDLDSFTDYFGREVLGLRRAAVERVIRDVVDAQAEWDRLLGRSFLSESMRDAYAGLLAGRRDRLGI